MPMLLYVLIQMDNILDLPRRSFRQGPECIDACVWLLLRVITFLNCAVAVIQTINICNQVSSNDPNVSTLFFSSVFLCVCCYHSYRLRFWQYTTNSERYVWEAADWVVILVSILLTIICTYHGFLFISTINALGRMVHFFYFRKAVVANGNLVAHYAKSGCSEASDTEIDEPTTTRELRYTLKNLADVLQLIARGQNSFPAYTRKHESELQSDSDADQFTEKPGDELV